VIWRIVHTISNLFWLWTILGTVWAWFYPDHFTWFITGDFPGTDIRLINLGLGVIMLGMGITLSVDDFKAVLQRPWVVGLGVFAQFLIMPLLGWSVATIFNLPPMLKLGVILVSCCPGGTASNVICYLARANVALSVLMTMCSTLAAILFTPLLTKAYASAILDVDAWAMFRSMLTIVLLPVVGGVLINQFFGHKLHAVKKVSPIVSILVIVLIVGGIVGATKSNIIAYFGALLIAILFCTHLVFCWDTVLAILPSSQKGTSAPCPLRWACKIQDSAVPWPSSTLHSLRQLHVLSPLYITALLAVFSRQSGAFQKQIKRAKLISL